MQNLNSHSPQINRSRRLQISKIFSTMPLPVINRSKSIQFIPFIQERDNLNRLICSSPTKMKRQSFNNLMAESKLINDQHIAQQDTKDEIIGRVVTSFFKKIDLEQKQLSRSRNNNPHKKIFMLTQRATRNNFHSIAEYDITDALQKVKSKNIKCIIKKESIQSTPPKLVKNFSNIQKRISESQTIKLHQSENLRSFSMIDMKTKYPNSSSLSPMKKSYQFDNIHKKSQSVINSLKVKLNPQQPDYKRYKQQQQRSLKVFQDYQEGHQKFKTRMKQSKLIAYKIKKELQID